MFNNEDRLILFFLDPVNESNCSFSGRRIKVGKRLIKQKNIHIVDHDTCHGNPLFLSAGKFRRRMRKKRSYLYGIRHLVHTAKHLLLLHPVVFQYKRDIFRYRQSDKLAIGILKYGTDHLGKSEDPKFLRILATDL